MSEPLRPTAYADVNAVLNGFLGDIRTILAGQFVGMYLYGSLALGDFDPNGSDIDFIVVTEGELDAERFDALRETHAQFAQSGSRWAAKIEAAYIPRDALNQAAPGAARYPQIETTRTFAREPLEIGWPFQRYTLRERSVVVAGPDPHSLTDLVDSDDMRRSVAAMTEGWLEQAHSDPSWPEWVRQRNAQAFVVLTLCRCLYALAKGDVASKPAAGRWAQASLGQRWHGLIVRALAVGRQDEGATPERDIEETIALIEYTLEQSRSR